MAARLVVSMEDPTPPYEQLRRQLVVLIGDGTLAPGERLPPLRQLAGDLGLAVGTVARTYRELESAQLVQSRRGGGTRVAATPRPPENGPAETDPMVRRELMAAVTHALVMGMPAEQIRRIVDEAMAATSTSTIADPA